MKRIRPFPLLLVCLLLLSAMPHVFAARSTLRVGWYEREGFQVTGENELKSGLAYEYLQEMARQGNFTCEYVPGTLQECLEWLEQGQVDVVAGVYQTAESSAHFAFSERPIDEVSTVLRAKADNSTLYMDDYASFDGMRVGVMERDERTDYLDALAQREGFSYRQTSYHSLLSLSQALENGEVDAILVGHGEIPETTQKIIAQFPPQYCYFALRKGDDATAALVNDAMEQVNFLNPSFLLQLDSRYSEGHKGHLLSYTREELDALRAHPVLRVTVASLRKPMMYQEDGEYKGFCIDILRAIAEELGVEIEFILCPNQLDAVALAHSGGADLVSNVYFDYGWAEANSLLLSKSYLDLDYTGIVRVGEPPTQNQRVAAVRGYLFSQYYTLQHYAPEQITWYNSEEDCARAVQQGEQDIAFANTYVANSYIQDYNYRGLYSYAINFSHGLSLAMPLESEDEALLSAIDKAITSISSEQTNRLIAANTMYDQHAMTFSEIIARNPLPFFLLFGALALMGSALAAIFVVRRNSHKKNVEISRARLESQRDSLSGFYNRLSYEVQVGELLRQRDGVYAFMMLDIDNFKTINDTHGHSYGDQVLVTLSAAIRDAMGEGCLLSRMGGDEFSAFFPVPAGQSEVPSSLKRLQALLDSGEDMSLTCSMGIAFSPRHGTDFDTLYNAADAALYRAKAAGKNRAEIAE